MAYCKKCKQDVEPGALCPLCGNKLPAKSLRINWTYQRVPVRDFLSWNSILRVALPVLLIYVMTVVGVEWARKGFLGVKTLMADGFPMLLLALFAAMLFVTFVLLLQRGREEVRYILDAKGVHAQVWQEKPSFLKLAFHLIPKEAQPGTMGYPTWMLEDKHIPWDKLRRVGTWPDRDKILLYSPRFLLCLPIHCLPDTYDDSIRFIYDHVKKMKDVMKQPPYSEEIQSDHL